MNINFTLCCDTCGENTNVRFGLSNRGEQPVRFACQSCGSPIDIVMGGSKSEITGATKVDSTGGFFGSETNFVDLHLDFPVYFGPYIPGMTPFMRAFMRLGPEEMQLHGSRLNHLNKGIAKARYFHTALKLYARQNVVPFKSNLKRIFNINVASEQPQDINAALYRLIANVMAAYEYPGQSREAVDEFTRLTFNVAKAHKPKLESFVQELIDSAFLKNLQLDVLEIYPKMLNAELVMRPALFLDFDEEYATNPIPMRVSTKDFESYKDLYKDISEIISRQLVLVAGLNNLLKRGDADAFASKLTKSGKNLAPATLNAFADVVLGAKQDFIDDSWYHLLEDSVDNRLRNAIAHYKTEYDEVTQLVTYYPKKEGMAQVQGEQIYFLEFVRRLLITYREMHRLHHLIKSLFYYNFLLMKKTA
ncbi:MAG: hypothetical protein KGQ79_01055 [Proteobacteria bacterium]|nr:hypothetical protein [Pseudomonadota bacterium]